MTNVISFKNVEPLNHFRQFAAEYLELTIGQFSQDRPLRATVMIEKCNTKTSQKHRDFSCEIVLYHPTFRKSLVAKKSGENIYRAIRNACHAAEKTLRRLAQTKMKRQHKNFNKTNQMLEKQLIGETYETASFNR